MVVRHCPGNPALYPAIRDKGDGRPSHNNVTVLRNIVEDETGIDFDMRKCRRTFGQVCLDEGLSIESTSVLMGHLTSKTTETSYARKREEAAISEANSLWKRGKPIKTPQSLIPNEPVPGHNPNLIETGKWDTGYIW